MPGQGGLTGPRAQIWINTAQAQLAQCPEQP